MINIKTQVLGLIGYPLGHSLSPLLHNQAIKELGLNYVYLAFEVEPANLREALEGIRALNVKGINVTIPFKEKVIPLLDEVDPLASQVGAVNTICNEGGYLKGYNTDVTGLRRMIEEDGEFNLKGKKAVVVGAGGAGRAAGFALCQAGIGEIYLLNRTLQKAMGVTAEWKQYYPGVSIDCGPLEVKHYYSILKEADLLIDTTPIGMAPEVDVPPVIAEKALHPELLVIDLVYNPRETTLLKAARRVGADTLDGLGMLLYQGIESFKIWTGYSPSVESWRELVVNNQ
jgi:shikimate dehydrogenase